MKLLSYRYLPLNFFIGYTIFVLLCLFVAPLRYFEIGYGLLLLFVFSVVVLFSLGFIAGARGGRFSDVKPVRSLSGWKLSFIKGLILYALLTAVIKWILFISSGESLNFAAMGESYVDSYDGYERGHASIGPLYLLNIFDQAVSTISIIFFSSLWGRLSKKQKWIACFSIFSFLLMNVVAVGKQKYLGDLVVFSTFAFMIRLAVKGERVRLRLVAGLTLLGVFVFFLFVEILRQRYIAVGVDVFNISDKSHPLIYWDKTSIIYDVLGDERGFAFGVFLSYFSNGLYGLYLSMTLPFEWCYMVGNSYSLGRIVEISIGSDGAILESTYPYRVGLEYGWGMDKWHSLFSWMASDIGFGGVLLICPAFGFLYGKLWVQSVFSKNFFAAPLFIYLSLGLIFCYANNQIMHTLAGVIVLIFLLVGWLGVGVSR